MQRVIQNIGKPSTWRAKACSTKTRRGEASGGVPWLANGGQDTCSLQHYLGHKNIMHTVRFTELSSERFKRFRED